MKLLILISLVLIFFVGTKTFGAIVKEGHYVLDSKKSYLNLFYSHPDLTVDLVSDGGYEVYGPDGLKEYLDRLKIPYTNIENFFGKSDDYPRPREIIAEMTSLANQYSHIAKIVKIGESIDGRDLSFIKISDNVEVDEVEPEFKYIGNMHGNEIANRDVLVRFVRYLLENYESNSEVAELINNTEIWIMPSMNPDGAFSRRRGNSNWTDLNRDFPDFTTSDNENTIAGRAIETKSVMNFQATRNFALSANFHGGTVCVNYPWDTTQTRPPLHELIKEISREYADKIDEMRNSTRFPGGIVNGYDWYEVNGGMQDWSFYWHGDLQVTIEMHDWKWPNYDEVDDYFRDHKDSLFAYIAMIHRGAGFNFEDKSIKGRVQIFKVDSRSLSKTDIGNFSFINGEFYKVLDQGNYEFMIETDARGNYYLKTTVEPDIISNNGNFKMIEI